METPLTFEPPSRLRSEVALGFHGLHQSQTQLDQLPQLLENCVCPAVSLPSNRHGLPIPSQEVTIHGLLPGAVGPAW